jgi:hypothetical protein
MSVAICTLFVSHQSFAGKKKLGHDHIISVDAKAKTIVVTNMSLGKPITLKVDNLMTEIMIDNKKAAFGDLHSNMPVAYVIGVNGCASRIAVENPGVKSVYRH